MQHAGPETAIASTRQPLRQAPAPASDLDRLKDILLGDELGALDALDARVDEPNGSNPTCRRACRGASKARGRHGAHGAARWPSRSAALGAAVRENRQVIVDVLFPVIGPAIRKAIAEALRNLVADVNGAIESSFTPRGLRWRSKRGAAACRTRRSCSSTR